MGVADSTSARPAVLITEPIGAPGLRILEDACTCIAPWRGGSAPVDAERLRARLGAVDAVIVRLFEVRDEELAAAPRLKVVAKHGAGLDNIDCAAAARRGVPVIYTPGANSNAVAEHTLGLLLAQARNTSRADATLRAAQPYQREQFLGIEVSGKTLGVVGLGRIGARVARKAAGLEMRVLAYDPYVDRSAYPGPARFVDSLEQLLTAADFVTLHVPLTGATKRMIDAAALARLKPGARLVNTSRGEVIDETALAAALRAGTLAGAALDVFAEEPLAAGHPLTRTPNTLLTPHLSGLTAEAMAAVSVQVAQGVIDVLQGRVPQDLLAPPAPHE